jgi:hypothetical protein
VEQSNQSFLATEEIGKLMRKYAVPCIISLLVGALYNIVDQIFIANASYLGTYGNAANGVVFPLTVVALAIAVMIGDGCCADYILREDPNCLRVFIHADVESRAKRIVEQYGETQSEPRKCLRDKDNRRAAYYQFYTDTKWGDVRNDHIALDSGKLGIEKCVEILAALY